MNVRRIYWTTALIALILTGVFFFTDHHSHRLKPIDVKGRDFFFRLRRAFVPPPPEADQVVLVNLDSETLRRLQLRWPYPRSIYAEALERLTPFSPKVIGFDLIFSGDDRSAGSDSAFVEALERAGNVVIAAHRSGEGEIGPTPLIRRSVWRVGVVDKPRDRDRVIRHAYLFFPIGSELHPSWELELFAKAFPEAEAETRNVPKDSPAVIDYRLQFDEFPQVSFWRLLEGSILADEIRNKIVLIGLTAEAFHDIHATPLGAMPGLAVNANVLLMVMRNSFFSSGPAWIKPLLAFFSFWLVVLGTAFHPFGLGLLITFFLIAIFVGVSFFLFSSQVIIDFWLLCLGLVVVLAGTAVVREGYLFWARRRLNQESMRDPLTGFYSRRFIDLRLKWELNPFISRRGLGKSDRIISVVIFDLDHFGLVNERLGRSEGDRMLSAVAETIRSSVRKNELISRQGNDEFCMLLLNTSADDAVRFAEKILKLLAANPLLSYHSPEQAETLPITVSIGLASWSVSTFMRPDQLLKAADEAFNRAKSQGGNQVCVFGSTPAGSRGR